MQPWRHWYHCNGSTYGTWLPGDPRGWRSRNHRVHVPGDYRTPPPPGRFDHAITALGGLIGPAILSMILFAVSTKPKWSKGAMVFFGGFCLLSVILVVRNPFGIVFVTTFAAIFLAIGYFASVPIAHFALVFVAVQLALSVFSRSDYLFTDTAQTAQGVAPSDVGQIADALLLPYWFWGALIALLSVAILGFGCWIYFRAYNGMKSNGS